MIKNAKVMLVTALMVAGGTVFAHPHCGKRDGLDLAAGIIGLVQQAIAPEAIYTVPQTVVVVAPPPRRYVRPLPPPPPRRYVRPLPPPPPRRYVRPLPPPPPRRRVRPLPPPPPGHHRRGYRR